MKINNLKIILKNKTLSQIIINSLGNYLNVGFTAFFAFLLVRLMDPVEYGVLSVLLGITYVFANILDLGVTATIYQTLPRQIESKDEKIFSFLKTNFLYQVSVSFAIVAFLLLIFPFLDKIFFKTQASFIQYFLTLSSVIFFIAQNFGLNCLLAAKRIFEAQLSLNLSNLVKTITLILFFWAKFISIESVLFSFGILGPTSFFLVILKPNKSLIKKIITAPFDRRNLKLSYTLTYFFASQFFNLGSRMDLFLLSYYFPKSQLLGHYSLATKVVLTLFAAIASITQILSPDFAKIKNRQEITFLVKKSFKLLTLPAFMFLALVLVPTSIFEFLFTKNYLNTAVITRFLALSYLVFPYLHIPLLYFLYTLKEPKKILYSNLIFFFSVSLLCFLLTPRISFYAGPLAILVGFWISGGYLFYNLFLSLKTVIFDKPQQKHL